MIFLNKDLRFSNTGYRITVWLWKMWDKLHGYVIKCGVILSHL